MLSVWQMFHDEDLEARPHPSDRRGRSVREHMVHQCLSEDGWFRTMFGIEAGTTPLPASETRAEFVRRYAEDADARLKALEAEPDEWWETEVSFFTTRRTRAWIMVRRIAHTSHHRGQQTAMLRMLNRDLHSNYGPTADTGGLAANQASVIYAYPDLESLLAGGVMTPLPGPGSKPVSERAERTTPPASA